MIDKGVLFNEIHSFFDLALILSGVDISPAKPKETYIDIPGADGSLDLTEAHGEVKYADRTIKLILSMNPGGDLSESAWEEKKLEVSNALNGKACRITLDKDPDYYWQGRCRLDSYTTQKRVRQFAIVATVHPYKWKQRDTVRSFDLSSTAQTVYIRNARKSVCPVIECSNTAKIVFGENTINFGAGKHKNLDIRFTEGNNQLTISGTGTVTFTFREGDL